MCVYSQICDQWGPHIPHPVQPWQPTVPTVPNPYAPIPGVFPLPTPPQVAEGVDNDTVKQLIEALRTALAAAEQFDTLTGQPDCVDPEKGKLLDRVEELERRLAEIEKKS